jgi:hypothetical protein
MDYGGVDSTDTDGYPWPYCDLPYLEASLRKVGLGHRLLWYLFMVGGGGVVPPMVLLFT